jgi:hypothetical protein
VILNHEVFPLRMLEQEFRPVPANGWTEDPQGIQTTPWSVPGAEGACAFYLLLQIPAWSSASSGTAKAAAVKPGIHSKQGPHLTQRQQWANNSEGTVGVRWSGRYLVGEIVSGCAQNVSAAAAANRAGRD